MLLSIAPNQQMGTIDFQKRPLVWSLNSQKPNCGFALNYKKVNRISTRQLNWRTITSALYDKVLDKEFGFKPSFNEYLKAMESVKHKSVNGSNNKFNRGSRTAEEKPQSTRKRPESTEQRPFPSLGSFDVEGERNKKLKNANELDSIKTKIEVARVTLESEAVENVNPNVNGKEQVRDYAEIFGGGFESGQYNRVHRTLKESGAFKNVASIVNSEGQVSDYGENFREVPETREYRMSKRNCKEEGYKHEIRKTGFPMANLDGRLDKREGENERRIEEEVELRNVKPSGSTRGLIRRGHDRYLEVERAAFRNVEEFTDFKGKPRLSRNEMEDRIQHLAKCLNGADINMPEWMFSKMMRSAKIRFCDHSILRIIQILGKLGNWRRVLQVIEWLQMRERYKSNKLRYIYTAALDALKKARRPVEALNVFHQMLGQMSSYPDLVTYRCIAIILGQAGHIKELFDVIDTMRSTPKKKFNIGPLEKWDPRLEPDIVVYNAVLNACVKRKHWEGAFWVLQQLKQQGLKPCTSTYGLVMEVMYACGKYNLVHEFFWKMQKSCMANALTYKVLINTFWREGKTDEAILAVQEMERRGIVGSASLYYDLARCLCSAGRCQEALAQIDKICKVANKPLVVTYTGLIQACLESGRVQDGAYIFGQMHGFCKPNLVTCNIMLKAYLEHAMFDEANNLFRKMLEDGSKVTNKADYKDRVAPDIYTFNIMLDACVSEKRWEDLEYIFKQMLQHGYYISTKHHVGMILDACRAGKGELLELTWKHLTRADQVPPPSLVKERFLLKLEEDDYDAALYSLRICPSRGLWAFSKKAWLNLLEENSHRVTKDALVGLIQKIVNSIAIDDSQKIVFQNLVSSCREFLWMNMLRVKTDQTDVSASLSHAALRPRF